MTVCSSGSNRCCIDGFPHITMETGSLVYKKERASYNKRRKPQNYSAKFYLSFSNKAIQTYDDTSLSENYSINSIKTSILADLLNSHFTNTLRLKPFTTCSTTELCIWSRNRSVSKVRVDWPRSSDDTTADPALLPCCTTSCNRAVTSECGISWTERNVNSDPKQFTLGVRCVPGQPPSRRRADILQPQTPHSIPVKHFYCWSAVFCKLTGYCFLLIIELCKTIWCL